MFLLLVPVQYFAYSVHAMTIQLGSQDRSQPVPEYNPNLLSYKHAGCMLPEWCYLMISVDSSSEIATRVEVFSYRTSHFCV